MKNEDPINYLMGEEKQVNYREIIEKYLKFWKWFVLGAFVAISLAFIYLRYTPKQYSVSTTILIDDSEKGGLPTELSAFEDLGLLTPQKKSVENELGILKSRTLVEQVVKDLGINVSFYTEGKVHQIELYKNEVPFKINFLSEDSTFYKIDTSFIINVVSASKFILKNADGEKGVEHSFGENITTSFGKFVVTPNELNNKNYKKEIKVQISPAKAVSEFLSQNIKSELADEKSSLINISFQYPIKQKAIDILNDFVRIYNANAVNDKKQVGISTNDFLNERLMVIEKDLASADKNIEQFKTTNKLTDISSEASLVVGSNAEIEKKVYGIKTQLKLADYVSEYLQTTTNKLIPANLGLSDGAISLNTENYNRLLLERNRILSGSSDKNPVIINLDDQLSQLRSSILQGLVNLKSSLNISLQDAQNQEYRSSSKISDVPKQETQFKDIERRQKIVETLYLFLLQKREENSISLAVTVPNSKIIDRADGSNIPVSPKSIIVMGIAVFMGILIPFLILFIRFMIDNKVHTIKEIEAVVKAPVLGDIPETKLKTTMLDKNNLDDISEGFRMLRTNLFFLLSKIKDRGKVIYTTSTVASEGKTYVSTNLAAVLALSGKKVLLIGADIRNPNLSEYLHFKVDKGLTHFLIDNEVKIPEIINHIKDVDFDIIATSMVAPNPSEILLMNNRYEELMEYGKKNYDFVIVDTAPVKFVTDTFLISQHADIFIYVVRANYLDKRLLEIPERIYKEKRLPNMAILLNFSETLKGYGYGYGYGYGTGYGKKGKSKGNVKRKG